MAPPLLAKATCAGVVKGGQDAEGSSFSSAFSTLSETADGGFMSSFIDGDRFAGKKAVMQVLHCRDCTSKSCGEGDSPQRMQPFLSNSEQIKQCSSTCKRNEANQMKHKWISPHQHTPYTYCTIVDHPDYLSLASREHRLCSVRTCEGRTGQKAAARFQTK